jgi:hypothetical protein
MSVSITTLSCGCFFAGRDFYTCEAHDGSETWVKQDEIKLEQTCGACPEQYDAFYNGERVGYLHLRHGHFRVEYPDCGGETVFEAHPNADGIFEPDERQQYLDQACGAIFERLIREGKA